MRGVPGCPEIGLDCRSQHDFHFGGRSGAFGGLVGLQGGAWGRFLVPREALRKALDAFWGVFWCPGEPFLGAFERIGILCSAFELNFGKVVRTCSVFSPPILRFRTQTPKSMFFPGKHIFLFVSKLKI